MDFLVQTAQAQASGGDAAGSPLMSLMLPILLLVVFYFLLIRPQQKRVKEHKQMVSELKKGDEVVTSGGLAGELTEVGDSFVQLQIADGIEVQIQKQSVASLLPKGTLKN
ncbi:MAG: preprotein translocase subunit YajC [Halofilum sp. (in: g-proteobacteria)]|jgi:preprotein translocase subunit YajC|nr:preprotein translocase subunit YajC [Halofilum sp. (in: g-proteobacteria)]